MPSLLALASGDPTTQGDRKCLFPQNAIASQATMQWNQDAPISPAKGIIDAVYECSLIMNGADLVNAECCILGENTTICIFLEEIYYEF